jgi:hypothetical protein
MRVRDFTTGICFWSLSAVTLFADECTPRNFMTMEVSPFIADDVFVSSILNAYDIAFDPDTSEFIDRDGDRVVYEGPTGRSPRELLTDATIGDQFQYLYPLDFDLTRREVAWEDPGRIRNEDFMRFLFGETEGEVRSSLTQVHTADGRASFNVTQRYDVDCQLEAALAQLGNDFPRIFTSIGGSFNWRMISGTSRLSVHSFGAAVDVNTSMGGYWRWSGAEQGAVGGYQNQIPEEVVSAFETYGFIWGGKWHHFDGMHFEYRPELIVYARLADRI